VLSEAVDGKEGEQVKEATIRAQKIAAGAFIL
jgi:hypothetical protein